MNIDDLGLSVTENCCSNCKDDAARVLEIWIDRHGLYRSVARLLALIKYPFLFDRLAALHRPNLADHDYKDALKCLASESLLLKCNGYGIAGFFRALFGFRMDYHGCILQDGHIVPSGVGVYCDVKAHCSNLARIAMLSHFPGPKLRMLLIRLNKIRDHLVAFEHGLSDLNKTCEAIPQQTRKMDNGIEQVKEVVSHIVKSIAGKSAYNFTKLDDKIRSINIQSGGVQLVHTKWKKIRQCYDRVFEEMTKLFHLGKLFHDREVDQLLTDNNQVKNLVDELREFY